MHSVLKSWGAWAAQSVEHPTLGFLSAQVMMSQFVSLSPASGSVLTAWSLLGILSLSLSLCYSPALSLSLCLSPQINRLKEINKP